MSSEEMVDWLRLQVDEDERVARSCSWPSDTVERVLADPAHYAWQPHDISPSRAAHIKRWESARVLREVEAHRKILDEHEHFPTESAARPGFGCGICAYDGRDGFLQPEGWCKTVRLLAAIYSDRPGYREEWRP